MGEILKSVDAVVTALGGTGATATLCGVKDSAVSNWKKEGFFPERHHHRIFRLCAERGLSVDEELLKARVA